MRQLIKSDFLWRFVGGFVIGAAGVAMAAPVGALTIIGHVAQRIG